MRNPPVNPVRISQRARLLALLLVMLVLGVLGQSALINRYVVEDFRQLEQNQVRSNARLIKLWLDLFLQPLDALARSAADWEINWATLEDGDRKAWQEFLEFIHRREPVFDSAALLSPSGEVLHALAIKPDSHSAGPLLKTTSLLLQRHAAGHVARREAPAAGHGMLSGWIATPEGLFASASTAVGPPGAPRAYIVLGRYFGIHDIAALEQLAGVTVTLPLLSPGEIAQFEPGETVGELRRSDVVSGAAELCSTLTPGLNPRRALLCVQLQESVYQRGKARADDLRLATVSGFVVLILTAWLFLDRALLRRLQTLVAELADTRSQGTAALEAVLLDDSRKQDELGQLSGGMSQLLTRVREVETDLRAQQNHLRRMTDTLEYQASHDELTGLTNRREFNLRLQAALETCRSTREPYALCYIDLDQFKTVNDICGHHAGDLLLQKITATLEAHARSTDTLARLGGDEFALLMTDCPAEQAVERANELRGAVSEVRFSWSGRSFAVDASIGIVMLNQVEGNMDEALSLADATCYVAKAQGRNLVRMYKPGDVDLQREFGQMRWAQRLKDALEHNHFRLYQQGIHPLAPRRPQPPACEILLRLADDKGGLIPAGTFLKAAERYQMMPWLDRWVVQNLLAHMRGAKGAAPRTYFVNLSGHSLADDSFHAFLIDALAADDALARQLVFEVTETAVISNLDKARDLMQRLRRRGVSFALDDFGTGMSSFGYLKELQVQYLKIAGPFVQGMVESALDEAIVRNFTNFGRQLGLTTIAESVENAETIHLLRKLRVDCGQGYALDLPAPLDVKPPEPLPVLESSVVTLQQPGFRNPLRDLTRNGKTN